VAKALNPSGFRRACPMAIAAIPVLSLISRNSPKQLGMVSPELHVCTAQGAPHRVEGRMAAPLTPGLGIIPRMDVLGEPAVVVA